MEIRRRYPTVAVLVLSHYLESNYAMRLLEEHLESVGYLLKDRVSDVAVLVVALRRVHEGESILDRTIVQRLVRHRRERDSLSELPSRDRGARANGGARWGTGPSGWDGFKTLDGDGVECRSEPPAYN